MKLKIFALLALLSIGLTACETPPAIDGGTNADTNTVTEAGINASGLGSENQGAGGGQLAPGVFDTVNFDYDSSAIRSDAQSILQAQARYLKENNKQIVVEGHCDERGTREYNLALGERRANAVKQALVSLGVEAGRISTISYGKERPLDGGTDEAAFAKNRRGVTVVK